MKFFILVRPEPAGQFTAQAVGIPELRATANSRELAIHDVQVALAQSLACGELVPIELPDRNPYLPGYGHSKDDPDFEEYLADIRRFRQAEDERESALQTAPVPFMDPNDPIEQEYLRELERNRREDRERTLRELDQECSDSSSTPTT
jgi:hypothetical protein